MKKIMSKIVSALLIVALMLSVTACGVEVENGSKITRVKMTVEFYNEDGVATEYVINAKLYNNFAPETIAAIKSKIESGYYNGTCISNVKSSYAQFGDYTLNADGSLTAKDQGSYIAGEFYKTGWTGNSLTAGNGALVLLRSDESTADRSKYDTAQSTIAISFSSSAFDAESYCIFGKLCDDDGDANSNDEMLKKSSYGKMYTLVDRIAEADGRRVYFCKNDDTVVADTEGDEIAYNWEGKYFTYMSYEEDMCYFEGIVEDEAAAKAAGLSPLTEEELADLQEKMSENADDFHNIPVLKVIIKKVEIAK